MYKGRGVFFLHEQNIEFGGSDERYVFGLRVFYTYSPKIRYGAVYTCGEDKRTDTRTGRWMAGDVRNEQIYSD